jgi:hypothetical protein
MSDTDMQAQFMQDFPKFSAKIQNFVLTTGFKKNAEQYEELFNQMSSIAPNDMKAYIEKSPAFLQARNESLAIMEKVVAIHKRLEDMFAMSAEVLGEIHGYDLAKIDTNIGKDIQESAKLIHQFKIVSERGRQAINDANMTM